MQLKDSWQYQLVGTESRSCMVMQTGLKLEADMVIGFRFQAYMFWLFLSSHAV